LSLPDFWRLTPGEFELLEFGYLWRRQQEHETMAYFATNLIASLGQFGKRRPNPKHIYKSLVGDGFLKRFECDAPGGVHPDNARKKKELEARARKRFAHLKGRADGTRNGTS